MLTIFKKITAVLAALLLPGTAAAALWYNARLADSYTAPPGHSLALHTALPIRAVPVSPAVQTAAASGMQTAQLRLFGMIPIKTVNMQSADTVWLVPSGEPFGCRMLMDGIMVIGFGEVFSPEGKCCPGASCGLQEGDIIRSAGAQEITSTEDFREQAASGEPMALTVIRGEEALDVTLEPAWSVTEQCWQTGLWVRDSTAGIGTMTFYDPAGQRFGGLGHPICDPDTGMRIPLASGEADRVTVSGAVRGAAGAPGCLQGYFAAQSPIGTLECNTGCGVFGTLAAMPEGEAIPMAWKQEVTQGDAVMLTTVEGSVPRPYTVRIEAIDYRSDTQNLVIEVTDPALLEQTGGIVQGMSGSPLIQNGRLVGAVTHVFVRDPARGYGVFAENMVSSLLT